MRRGVPTCTPLIRASDAGNLVIVRLLLRYGAEVNARDGYNNTALLKATTHNNLDIVRELLEQGANPNLEGLMFDVDAKEDNFTVAPLHIAAQEGYLDVLRALLRYGAYVEARSSVGHTSLHLAVMAGQRDTASVLLDKGADPNAATWDDAEAKPLEMARKMRFQSIENVLLRRGASRLALDNDDGNTYLHMHVLYGDLTGANKTMSTNPALVETRNADGETPVEVADRLGNDEMLKLLLGGSRRGGGNSNTGGNSAGSGKSRGGDQKGGDEDSKSEESVQMDQSPVDDDDRDTGGRQTHALWA